MNNKYTIIKQESIEELNGTGYILKHDKTGARVVVISNEDDNKVFQIGFRLILKKELISSFQVLILNLRQKSGCVKPSVQMRLE